MKLTSYPGTVRQLIVTGLGRDAPTVIITNDDADHHQGPDRAVRPADDHRAAPRRDHPGILRRRPVQRRQPQRRPRRRPVRPGPGPHRRLPAPPARQLRPRHPRHPPAPLPGHPRRDHQRPAPASPSRSTAAPTHPSSARPTCPPTPPSPGGTDASSTSNSPDPRANWPVRKSALKPMALHHDHPAQARRRRHLLRTPRALQRPAPPPALPRPVARRANRGLYGRREAPAAEGQRHDQGRRGG